MVNSCYFRLIEPWVRTVLSFDLKRTQRGECLDWCKTGGSRKNWLPRRREEWSDTMAVFKPLRKAFIWKKDWACFYQWIKTQRHFVHCARFKLKKKTGLLVTLYIFYYCSNLGVSWITAHCIGTVEQYRVKKRFLTFYILKYYCYSERMQTYRIFNISFPISWYLHIYLGVTFQFN